MFVKSISTPGAGGGYYPPLVQEVEGPPAAVALSAGRAFLLRKATDRKLSLKQISPQLHRQTL